MTESGARLRVVYIKSLGAGHVFSECGTLNNVMRLL